MTYDEQIQYLTENPGEIHNQWGSGIGLFKFLSPKGKVLEDAGCLTMIRNHGNDCYAFIKGKKDLDFTQKVKSDQRLPAYSTLIGVEHLPVFKEWQERFDVLENA